MSFQPPSVSQDPSSLSGSQGAARCLVFTDARGKIVFADSNFLDLISQNEAISLVGKPLYEVLKVSQQSINELMSSIAQMGYTRDHILEIQTLDENSLNVACTGVATYDELGAFVGADLTLCDIARLEPTEAYLGNRSDGINTHVEDIQNGKEGHQRIEEKQIFVLGYFTAQVTALQMLLGRMGGSRVLEKVETLINQAADQHNWPIQLQGGHLNISNEGPPLNAYATLLGQVVEYGTNIIGRQAIVHEMQVVDSRMTEHMRRMAEQAGLSRWIMS